VKNGKNFAFNKMQNIALVKMHACGQGIDCFEYVAKPTLLSPEWI